MQHHTNSTITVAQFLSEQIDRSGKTQKQIAEESGFDCANMITMMKQGLSKVPLNRVGAIARALDIDAAEFMRMVMAEYMPCTLAAIEEILPMLSESERRLIRTLRRIRKDTGAEPAVCDGRDVVALVMV